MTIDVNDLRIAATVLSLLTFLGICAWATARRNRARFDAAAQLPLHDDAAQLPGGDVVLPDVPGRLVLFVGALDERFVEGEDESRAVVRGFHVAHVAGALREFSMVSGMRTVTLVPASTRLWIDNSPPCSATRPLTIDSPSPVPSWRR